MLTNASVEFHGNDRALVALVLPSAVPKLGDPTLGRTVCRAAVHQTIHHQDADHRICVAVHRLVRVNAHQMLAKNTFGHWNKISVGKGKEGRAGSEKAVPWVSQQATINSVKSNQSCYLQLSFWIAAE